MNNKVLEVLDALTAQGYMKASKTATGKPARTLTPEGMDALKCLIACAPAGFLAVLMACIERGEHPSQKAARV